MSAQAQTSIAGAGKSVELLRRQQLKARWRARVGYPESKEFPWHLNLEYLESYWEVEHQSLLVPTGLTAYRMSCSIDWSRNVSLFLQYQKDLHDVVLTQIFSRDSTQIPRPKSLAKTTASEVLAMSWPGCQKSWATVDPQESHSSCP